MDRKKCRRIVKKVIKIATCTDCRSTRRGNRKRKEGMGKKVVGQKYTWWISTTFQRTVCRDPAEYRACLRMSPECFDTLHDLIANAIQRNDILMRGAIPSRIKLEVTLSFLATGNSYRNLQHLFRVSKAAISKFIP